MKVRLLTNPDRPSFIITTTASTLAGNLIRRGLCAPLVGLLHFCWHAASARQLCYYRWKEAMSLYLTMKINDINNTANCDLEFGATMMAMAPLIDRHLQALQRSDTKGWHFH